MMLASVTHILPLTLIRRERLLPALGKVVVRKGQKVSATDTIAEASLDPDHLLLDVAKGLGLTPDKADAWLTCQAGDPVSEGDVLAGPTGFPRRVVRAPGSGKVLLAGNGQVLLELQTRPYELKAALPGVVLDLIADRGAVIETAGALIQGVWGNGKVDYGLLSVALKEPGDELTAGMLDVSLRGFIVLGGHVEAQETLKSAAELPLRGLILASMNPDLLSLASTLPVPILLLEGFGQRPMNAAAFQLLTTNDGREAAINAEVWDRFTGVRPEVVIPLPAPANLTAPAEVVEFAKGQVVRIVSGPYASQIGTIENFAGSVVLPSGLRASSAGVRLGDGDPVVVPLSNLDAIQ